LFEAKLKCFQVLNKKEVNTKKNKLVQAKHELISAVLKNNLYRAC
jgi:hypothetical protein